MIRVKRSEDLSPVLFWCPLDLWQDDGFKVTAFFFSFLVAFFIFVVAARRRFSRAAHAVHVVAHHAHTLSFTRSLHRRASFCEARP